MKFTNLQEGIDYIIASLTQSEKDIIKNADPAGIHLALARWVNNNYISNGNYNFRELVLNKFNADEAVNIHTDNIVGILIDEIIKRFKEDNI